MIIRKIVKKNVNYVKNVMYYAECVAHVKRLGHGRDGYKNTWKER